MSALTRIFLVEDDLDDQGFFTEALDTIQNTLLMGVARDGQDALNQLRAFRINPDIIFMDINMPVMNGIDCLKEIKSIPRLQSIPVVILSTNVQSEVIYSLGAKTFIKKPVGVGELRNEIDHALHVQLEGMEHAGVMVL